MENFRKVLMAGISVLAFSFITFGAQAQSWIPKVEKNGITVSVAQETCGGHTVLLYRVANTTQAAQTVNYAVSYNAGNLQINQSKVAYVASDSAVEAKCGDAATGVTDAFYLIPTGVNVDLDKVNIVIQ